MKIKIALTVLAMIGLVATAQAKEWYEGGTLQKASIEKFLAAKPANQLATVAEFITGAMTKETLETTSLDQLKEAAAEVVECMKTAPEVFKEMPAKTAHAYAGMCQLALKKKYPWLVSIMD